MNPHKVIYDTDPGVDDAMALYYALAHPAIELVGITTTFGNVQVQQATANALYLLELTGRAGIAVTQGAAQPLVRPAGTPPVHIHGADGLGNLTTRQAVRQQAEPRSSAQFMVDMVRAHPGEITLVPVGPLGNLALALQIEPQLPRMVKQVVLMGGAAVEPGNVSPVAEANIWNDPHAADAVFNAGWPLTMVGLDVTHQVIVPLQMIEAIAAHHCHPATDVLLHAVDFYANFYSNLYPHVAQVRGCFGHDVLAFIALTRPELFGTQTGRLRVATEGIGQGQTMFDRRGITWGQPGWEPTRPQVQVCMQVDAAAALADFEKTLMLNFLKK
jgi:inosine-uridine nucleoside N-ribohydrolase